MSFSQSIGATVVKPVISATSTSEPPIIDGILLDACWKTCTDVDSFFIEADGTNPVEKTSVQLCYDRRNIYISFYCHDSQPDKIIAQQTKRGGTTVLDDSIGVYLDCYNNNKVTASFTVSAGGVQNEILSTGDVSNTEWKGDWHAAVCRVADGYVVEMSIPFSILRYEQKQTAMGILFKRQHARTQQTWCSPNTGANQDIEKSYLWNNLMLPIPRSRPLVLGYNVLSYDQGKLSDNMGADMKYSITPSLTATAAIKPDFRDVEQQVDSIDFTYTERYRSESRPFFLESERQFPSGELFYSRRIQDIDIGLKLAGKINDCEVGFLNVDRFGEENHSVFQLSRAWGSAASLSMAGVYSHTETGDGFVGELSGSYRLSKKGDRDTGISTMLASSNTGLSQRDLYSGVGLSSSAGAQKLSWSVSRLEIGSDYDAPLGYVPVRGISDTVALIKTFDQPSKGSIAAWQLGLMADLKDKVDGSVYDHSFQLAGNCYWRKGIQFGSQLVYSEHPPFNDRIGQFAISWGQRSLFLNGSLTLRIGNVAGGDYRSYLITQGLKMSHKLKAQLSYEHSAIKHPSPAAFSSGQWILTITHDLDKTHTLAIRLVSRDTMNNIFMAFKQKVSAGTDIWVTFGDPNTDETRNRVMIKLVRPLLH